MTYECLNYVSSVISYQIACSLWVDGYIQA